MIGEGKVHAPDGSTGRRAVTVGNGRTDGDTRNETASGNR